MSLTEDYKKIVEAGMSPNLFDVEEYEKFYENCKNNKSKIYKMMGNKTRLIYKVKNTDMEEFKEREFHSEFRNRIKDLLGINKEFFSVIRTFPDSDLINNKHKSGKKYTKFLKEELQKENIDEGIIEQAILTYSQVKNSYVTPNCSLVISVEPIDFLLMGVGKGWHTCYTPNEGDYFTGSFSLGLDSYSFLTYFVINGEIINPLDKIYRRVGVFSEDYKGFMLSTQYPYKNKSFEDFTCQILNTIFFEESYEKVHNKNIKVYKNHSSQIYNDFVSSPKKENLYIGKPREGKYVLYYGENVKCLKCGKNHALNDVPLCVDCLRNQEEVEYG